MLKQIAWTSGYQEEEEKEEKDEKDVEEEKACAVHEVYLIHN